MLESNIGIKYWIGIRTKTKTRDIGLEPKPLIIVGTNTAINTTLRDFSENLMLYSGIPRWQV